MDGRASINLMLSSILRKIGKKDTDLRSHNMCLFDYEGKTRKALGVIQLEIFVGTIVRPALFMVISSK